MKPGELPSEGPLPKPVRTDGAKSLSELDEEGLVAFALGPVYVYAGVREDIVRRFVMEMDGQSVKSAVVKDHLARIESHRLDVRGTTLHFDRAVLARCMDWNNILNVMDKESYPHFKKWLLEQQFVNRAEKKFYVVRCYAAPVLDPLTLDLKGLALPVTLDVFSVSGLKGALRPLGYLSDKAQAKSFIDFEGLPPEEDVIVLGRKALRIIEEA
jgi:hypothetical protein